MTDPTTDSAAAAERALRALWPFGRPPVLSRCLVRDTAKLAGNELVELAPGQFIAVSDLINSPETIPVRNRAGVAAIDYAARYPEGRFIFYEGDDPAGFAKAVKSEFDLDVTKDSGWAEYVPYGEARLEGDPEGFTSYGFHCPPELLAGIYFNDRWPMGS